MPAYTAVLGTTKITRKHMPLINELYKTSRHDSAFNTYNMASQCSEHRYGQTKDIAHPMYMLLLQW